MKMEKLVLLTTPARLLLLCVLMAAALISGLAPVARADTLTVCASGCDHARIRDAIDAAGADDTISVLDAVHTEVGIAVRKSVTIQGQGIGSTIVQAQTLPNIASSRVFAIHSGVTVTIRDMTIRYGNIVAGPAQGGGIYNNGTLTLRDVLVTENRAEGDAAAEPARGGGIYNNGTLTVQDSTIQNNLAQGGNATAGGDGGNAYGGGISNDGALDVQNGVVHGNNVQGGDATGDHDAGGDVYGGGIYNNGLLTVQTGTISDNTARAGNAGGQSGEAGYAYGGGVAHWKTGSSAAVFANSTLSGNTAWGGDGEVSDSYAGNAFGGGVALFWPVSSPMSFTNSTISGNIAQGGEGLGGQQNGSAEGGGLRGGSGVTLSYCTVTNNQATGHAKAGGGVYSPAGLEGGPDLKSSIVADNGPAVAEGSDLYGNVQSSDYNLIQSTSGYTLSGPASHNLEGVSPQLGPLAENGGPTETHALPDTSPAMNHIPSGQNGCGATVAEDQRGMTRPQDGACDIGSFELEKIGQLEVLKALVPGNDPGTFDLEIDGVTNKAGATDGDSTGKKTVTTGVHTVAESGGTFANLDDYNIDIECRGNGGGGGIVANGNDPGPLPVTIYEGDDIVCTITNVRKTGHLEVVKDVVPNAAPGKFNLKIDGAVKKANAADGGTTGRLKLPTGVHTVSETSGTSTDLANYNSSIECRGSGGQGEIVASGDGTGPVPVTLNEDDDIVCTITNARKTGYLEVEKEVVPNVAPGKFDLQIDGITQKSNAADGDSTGKKTVFTGGRTVGEVAGDGTDLADFNSRIECRDGGGQGDVVASSSNAGPLTVAVAENDDILCTIRNERKTGILEVAKDLEPDEDPGKFDLQVDGVTRESNASDGDSTGKLVVYTGDRAVGEEAGDDTELADYNSRIECRENGGQGDVVASDTGAGPLTVRVNEHDDILCTIRNERKTGFLEVAKDLEPDSDPGRFNLQIDGVTKEANAGDRDTTGRLEIPTGQHTVGEIAGEETSLSDYSSSIECRDNGGGGIIVASGDDAGPLPVTLNENINIVCIITNVQRGKIIIEKQTNPAGATGFEFANDIAVPYGFTLDDNENTKFRRVAPGEYDVIELVPDDWYLTDIDCDDPDGGTSVDLETATATIDLDPGEEIACTFENSQMANLDITKTATPNPIPPGESLEYTLAYSNVGSKPALDVTITDIVPDVLYDVQFESDRPITPTGAISYAWDVGDLDPGEGGTITIQGTISSTLTTGLIFTNTASMTTSVPEWDPDNSSDAAVVEVIRLAPLAQDDTYSTKTDTPLISAPESVLDNDTDMQGDPLTAALDAGPGIGDLILYPDGTFVYTPGLEYVGLDTFTYYANDGILDSNIATVTIGVGIYAQPIYLPLVMYDHP